MVRPGQESSTYNIIRHIVTDCDTEEDQEQSPVGRLHQLFFFFSPNPELWSQEPEASLRPLRCTDRKKCELHHQLMNFQQKLPHI